MTQDEQIRLGRYITAVREERGMSLRALARAVGTSAGQISMVESGQRLPQPDTLGRLADALGIEWEDLYALAGYGRPKGLPSFGPYLRSRYGSELSPEQVAALEQHFQDLTNDLDRGES